MKKFAFLLSFFLIVVGLLAQNRGVAPLARGEKQINFGAGFSHNGVPAYFSVDFALHKDVTLTPEIHALIPFPDKDFRGGVMMKADYHWNYLLGYLRTGIFMLAQGPGLVLVGIYIPILDSRPEVAGTGAVPGA